MKKKTRHLAQQVRDAFLALSDALLMETILEWIDLVERDCWNAEIGDEYRYVVGYRIQSEQTGKVYARFEDAFEAESDDIDVCFVDPDAQMMRASIESLSVEMFYHCIVSLAGEALHRLEYAEHWGAPPGLCSDGYDFMNCLANYLRVKELHTTVVQKLQEGHMPFSLFPGEATGRRRPMGTSRKGMPSFVTRYSN